MDSSSTKEFSLVSHSSRGRFSRGLRNHRAPLRNHPGDIGGFAWSPDGALFATASSDQTIRLWQAETNVMLRTLVGHQGKVDSLAWAPDGRRLASSGHDLTTRVWDVGSGQELHRREWQLKPLAMTWSPTSHQLSICEDIRVLRWVPGDQRAHVKQHLVSVTGVTWIGSDILASSDVFGSIELWNTKTKHRRYIETGSACLSLAYSPHGNALACGHFDGSIQIWHLKEPGPGKAPSWTSCSSAP